jgi:imidazolonepropionase-like amidohydrolase
MKRPLSFLFLSLFLVVTSHSQTQNTKAIIGGTVIDGAARAPIKDAVIIIEGARIKEVGARNKMKIPKGAYIIDAQGKFVIPGLADMHNHLGDGSFNFAQQDPKKNLAELLAWGITTVFDTAIDMKSFSEFKKISAEDTASYPRFFAVGRQFGAKGGWGSFQGGYTPDTPDEARAAVREMKSANVDAIKIVYDDMSWLTKRTMPMLKPEVMGAIIDEAHQQGLRAYVHAPILKYAREALRAGADGFVHGIISDPVDDDFVTSMKKNRAVYIATLVLFEACADLAGWSQRERAFDDRGIINKEVYDMLSSPATIKQWVTGWNNIPYTKERMATLRANLKKLSDAGVPVVTGTDTGVPGVLLGVSSQMELTLMAEAGLKPEEVIRAATINAARMIGREKDLGSIEAGKLADLVILDANPLADVRNIRRTYRVMKGGVLYDPAQLFQTKAK